MLGKECVVLPSVCRLESYYFEDCRRALLFEADRLIAWSADAADDLLCVDMPRPSIHA